MTNAENGHQTYDYDDLWRTVYGDMQTHGPVHRHMYRLLRKMLRDLDFRTVLDVGCGPGHNFELLSDGRTIDDFSGIDISEEALEQARRHVPGGSFSTVDIEHEAPAGSWDLLFCSLVMEHVVDDVEVLRNMRAAASRHVVITTIAGDYERYRRWDEYVGHVRNYRRGELEEKLVQANFRPVQSIYWGFPFYTPLVRTAQNMSKVGTGAYGTGTQLLTKLLYGLYFLNSAKRGDLLIVHAVVDEE